MILTLNEYYAKKNHHTIIFITIITIIIPQHRENELDRILARNGDSIVAMVALLRATFQLWSRSHIQNRIEYFIHHICSCLVYAIWCIAYTDVQGEHISKTLSMFLCIALAISYKENNIDIRLCFMYIMYRKINMCIVYRIYTYL